MGNAGGKTPMVKKREMDALVAATRFTPEEIKALYLQFASLKDGTSSEMEISQREFQIALGYRGKTSRFVDRIFALFDGNHDGRITFTEFVHGLAKLSPNAVLKDKLKFSFDIYNVSGDGFISREELSAMIQGALEENDVSLSAGEVGAIVDATFREVDTNSDGVIDFAEYSAMVQKQPSILKPLTLNVSELINTSRSPVGEASGK